MLLVYVVLGCLWWVSVFWVLRFVFDVGVGGLVYCWVW